MNEKPAKLSAYAALVRSWAPRLGLISRADLERFEQRHVDDSLRALPLIDSLPEGPAIDVGSGAGLPGIPLAIAGFPRFWRLLEPRTRRAGFLEEVVRELELDCEVLVMRAEEAARDAGLVKAHVIATSRALATPSKALALTHPLVARNGCSLAWVGKDANIPTEATVWRPGIVKLCG